MKKKSWWAMSILVVSFGAIGCFEREKIQISSRPTPLAEPALPQASGNLAGPAGPVGPAGPAGIVNGDSLSPLVVGHPAIVEGNLLVPVSLMPRNFGLTSTSGVSFDDDWHTISGLSLHFSTIRAASLVLYFTGHQRTATNTGNEAGCLVAYRFHVDGTPRGHASYGQRVTQSGAEQFHNGGTGLNDYFDLAAGSHTIHVQAKVSYRNCWVCAEHDGSTTRYTDCNLTGTLAYKL